VTEPRDPTLDLLLDLDGQILVVDPEGGHWVRFVVTRVRVSPEKPHGIDYSLTLHGPDRKRLAGFDNAHPVGRRKRRTIAIGCGRSGCTNTATRRPFWRTLGARSMRYCATEE
jgi:hypothetical protein